MKALHFGAGNIGLGFVGKTLSESNFDVIFSDVNQGIIDAINNRKHYFVRIVGKKKDSVSRIDNVSGININNPMVIKKITLIDIITTAVGFHSLDKIASVISEGIILKCNMKAIQPLNIIACENIMNASSILKTKVLNKLPEKYHFFLKKYIGFVDCSIDTIIPYVSNKKENSLLVAEDFQEWIVNINQFKGEIPKILNMKLSNKLDSFIARKLFTLNTGHAITAYLGLIQNYKTINEAILDKKIRFIVKSAMQESGYFLIKHYNFNENDHMSYIDKIFFRFENPFLLDNLTRIARNPLQKLKKEERLIRPLLGCIKYGLSYTNLAKGIAAAFHYHNVNDLESIKLSNFVKNQGIKKTLSDVCGLSQNSQAVNFIISEYNAVI